MFLCSCSQQKEFQEIFILYKEGRAERLFAGWPLKIGPGDRFNGGMTLKTPGDGKTVFLINSAGVFWLGASSEIEIKNYSSGRKKIFLKAGILFVKTSCPQSQSEEMKLQ